MRKHIVFDMDGVIITGPRASDLAIEKFSLKKEAMQNFFRTKWSDCVEGRVPLRGLLMEELPRWGFQGSVDEYLKFWFETEGKVSSEMLEYVRIAKSKGIQCHIGSNQENLRAAFCWETCGLNRHFDRCFFSGHLGFAKPALSFYRTIQEKLNSAPEELLLVDDTLENVQAAKRAGWGGVFWPQEIETLRSLFK